MSSSKSDLRSSQLSDDELRLQLLVDGQLDHSERSQWLATIPVDSDQWRRIALHFVENQIIDEAIGCSKREPQQRPKLELTQNSDGQTRQFKWAWLAVAASMLVGWFLGSQFFQPDLNTTTLNTSQSSIAEDVDQEDSSELVGLRLPLEDALARSIRPVSLDTHRAFLKAGYLVDESSEIASVELPTGNSVQMPVRQVKIRYLGNAAFQ
jgi:hypothetical protein